MWSPSIRTKNNMKKDIIQYNIGGKVKIKYIRNKRQILSRLCFKLTPFVEKIVAVSDIKGKYTECVRYQIFYESGIVAMKDMLMFKNYTMLEENIFRVYQEPTEDESGYGRCLVVEFLK